MDENKKFEYDFKQNHYDKENKTNSKIIVAGFFLIIAGVLSIIMCLFIITTLSSNPEQFINISQFTELNPDITQDDIIGLMNICLSIIIVISIFPILGGILCFRRKLWTVCFTCAIVGILTIILVYPGILSIIAAILLFVSKKEFH